MKAPFYKFIEPRSSGDDYRRKEFILNVLLISAIFLIVIAIVSSATTLFFFSDPMRRASNALSFGLLFGILVYLLSLLILSRKGFFHFASYFLFGLFFLLSVYMDYRWGIELIASTLFFALIIVMAGILINTRFAFIAVGIITFTLIFMGRLQDIGVIKASRSWMTLTWNLADITMVSVIFLVIATVSWLSNREIEKSLFRARKSEAELKEERDSLEVKVEQRTKELKEVQAEKMTQLYRFAEFGRISSGLFHDLINPLNAVSLNLGKVNVTDKGDDDLPIEETKQFVNNAVRAAKKIEDLVVAVRKQLSREETRGEFVICNEIDQIMDVLAHKSQKARVELRFMPYRSPEGVVGGICIFGDAIKFHQIVLNLVGNGIDACQVVVPASGINHFVEVSVSKEQGVVVILVADTGVGIPEAHIAQIFEPFFTTKIGGQGIGLGLSIAKRITEKDFGGTLAVESKLGKGSRFRVRLPVQT